VRYQGGLEQAGLGELLDEETDRRAHVLATEASEVFGIEQLASHSHQVGDHFGWEVPG